MANVRVLQWLFIHLGLKKKKIMNFHVNKQKFVHISCEGVHPMSTLCSFYVNIVHQFLILNDQD